MADATLTAVIPAPRSVVYGVFADRERYSEFLPLPIKLVEEGSTERQGVGAVHHLGIGRIGVKERITELVPLKRISYEVASGVPFRRHVGEITFVDDVHATRVTYRMESTLSIPLPRPLLALALRGVIFVMLRGAGREARRRSTDIFARDAPLVRSPRYPDSGSMKRGL
jgi:uncharacterized protein YndB with AHSA1/START domain